MKKYIKIIIAIFSTIILYLIIDLICIYRIQRPLFAIRTDNDGSVNVVYKGLFYDTYNCIEYSVPQIKGKRTKFSCSIDRLDIGKVIDIVDTTKDIKNFSCPEVLEEFYKDDSYTYYYNCAKSKYVIVKYESGFEETVKNALKYNSVTINDLDNFNIDYIKQKNDYLP